jgi:hypothetical protein
MLVGLTRSAAVATFQEKRGKKDIRLGYFEGGKLRTIVERENVLPHCARRAQQQIRLHEVTGT